jgi:hypothetical protein
MLHMKSSLLRLGLLVCLAFVAIAALVACRSSHGSSSRGSQLELLPRPDMSQPMASGVRFRDSCAHHQEYDLAFTPSDKAADAMVFQQDYPQVDAAYASEIASRLGINAEPVLTDSPLYSGTQAYKVRDENGFLSVDTETGHFAYGNLKASRASAADNQANTDWISEDQAIGIANDFLRESGLLPEGKLLATVKKWPYYIDVFIEPEDTPLAIIDSAMEVELVGDGEVRILDYWWTPLHTVGNYPTISEAAAFDKLRGCEGYVLEGIPYPQMKVAKVELVYAGFPFTPRPDHLMPMYEFSTDDPDILWNAWVPAVADEYLD